MYLDLSNRSDTTPERVMHPPHDTETICFLLSAEISFFLSSQGRFEKQIKCASLNCNSRGRMG